MSAQMSPLEGQSRIVSEVINRGLCIRCGGCVGLCPYFHYYDGKVVVSDGCEASTWRCVQICPRLLNSRSSLYQDFFGKSEPGPLGGYLKIIAARSTEPKIREWAQYGGVVTSLAALALEKGLIRAIVLTDKGEELSPKGVLCTDREGILACAGSRYTASGSLGILNKAIKEGHQDLGFVGLPCQMEALARMASSEPDGEQRAGSVTLRLGLFCTWALDHRALRSYLEAKGISSIARKYDIPPPPSEIFLVDSGDTVAEFPLSEVRELVQQGCKYCEDMTAEFADISVGALEGDSGWNTVIVRSERGLELFDMAFHSGVLEYKEMPQANLDHLIMAAANKRNRAVKTREEEAYG